MSESKPSLSIQSEVSGWTVNKNIFLGCSIFLLKNIEIKILSKTHCSIRGNQPLLCVFNVNINDELNLVCHVYINLL